MRLLHTSDWHLGISHGATSRDRDHDHFLAWLTEQLAEHEVDALVVAGDVFDSMQPSADALRRYYRFLVQAAGSGLGQVLVVGGNHDSASRLDAPSEVLAALDVSVVGGIGGSDASWERCLVPLRRRAGDIAAVALAVPYVHEFRLGIRTTDLDREGIRAAFEARFGALYRHLADRAHAEHPGLPLVATGHLTLGAARREDYPHEIHQVGTIEGLPASVLDPRIQYAALGHIHRCYPVDDARRAWYSGSPVAYTLPEARTARQVLLVDLDPDPAGAATVTRLTVPSPRALRELRAEPDALVAEVRDLTWGEPLPPLLFCRAVADAVPADLVPRLHAALAAFPEAERPALVELRQERATPTPAAEDDAPMPPLDSLEPTEVFATLCRSVGLTETAALASAFAELASATDEDLEAMLAGVREASA